MQHNSLIIWLVTVTGDWGVHVGSNIGMFTFWHEHNTSNQNPSNSKTDKFWLQCKDFPNGYFALQCPTFFWYLELGFKTAQSPKSQPVYSGQGPIILWGHGALTLKGTMIRLPSGTGWSDPENQRDQPAYQICQESVAFLKWPFYACFCFTRSLCFVFLCVFLVGKKAEGTVVPFSVNRWYIRQRNVEALQKWKDPINIAGKERPGWKSWW